MQPPRPQRNHSLCHWSWWLSLRSSVMQLPPARALSAGPIRAAAPTGGPRLTGTPMLGYTPKSSGLSGVRPFRWLKAAASFREADVHRTARGTAVLVTVSPFADIAIEARNGHYQTSKI